MYLTADATDELAELKEDEVYIIGGICDHNRYKVRLLCIPHQGTHTLNGRTYDLRTSASQRHKHRASAPPDCP